MGTMPQEKLPVSRVMPWEERQGQHRRSLVGTETIWYPLSDMHLMMNHRWFAM